MAQGADDMGGGDAPLAHLLLGETILVTVDNWFFGPDGRQYRAVFGTLRGVHTAEATLGVRPNGRSTNWYIEVGSMVVAGCQVHYAMRCDECPADTAPDFSTSSEHGLREFVRPSCVFNADAPELAAALPVTPVPAPAPTTTGAAVGLPKIDEIWPGQGGIYAGIARGRDGRPDHHLILCQSPPPGRLNWEMAKNWADNLMVDGHNDFTLPDRWESALLYANLADHFEHEWHWTASQFSAGSAWSQDLDSGCQSNYDEGYEFAARAVRRFPVNPSILSSAGQS